MRSSSTAMCVAAIDHAQIAGGGLLRGDEFQTVLLDVIAQLVDLVVVVDDLLSQVGVARL